MALTLEVFNSSLNCWILFFAALTLICLKGRYVLTGKIPLAPDCWIGANEAVAAPVYRDPPVKGSPLEVVFPVVEMPPPVYLEFPVNGSPKLPLLPPAPVIGTPPPVYLEPPVKGSV